MNTLIWYKDREFIREKVTNFILGWVGATLLLIAVVKLGQWTIKFIAWAVS